MSSPSFPPSSVRRSSYTPWSAPGFSTEPVAALATHPAAASTRSARTADVAGCVSRDGLPTLPYQPASVAPPPLSGPPGSFSQSPAPPPRVRAPLAHSFHGEGLYLPMRLTVSAVRARSEECEQSVHGPSPRSRSPGAIVTIISTRYQQARRHANVAARSPAPSRSVCGAHAAVAKTY